MSFWPLRLPSMVFVLGVFLCGGFTPTQAWAWAPMCDLTASTAIAPMVAPPVDSGEIAPCFLDFENDEDAHAAFYGPTWEEGQVPRQPAEDSSSHHLQRFPLVGVATPKVAPNLGLSLVLPPFTLDGGPRAGFVRSIERPPCAV